MGTTELAGGPALAALAARIDDLEARIARLESGQSGGGGARRRAGGGAGAGAADTGAVDVAGWTAPYELAELEAADSWIELHEPSARPHLQRMLRTVVEVEGPVTDRLALDRIRRAWGLKRAGGRVQEAFDQAVRQLLARGIVERDSDALRVPGAELAVVRVPGDDELSRRGAEDVPLVELARALHEVAARARRIDRDELTMQVARVFGWTRRGGAIQERLDAGIRLAVDRGQLELDGAEVRAAAD